MPLNHDPQSFVNHQLNWTPGQTGKGFLIKPTPTGVKNWPELAQAKPLVWTWPTTDMTPTHPQMKTQTPTQVPQGMTPDPPSYFHIEPNGDVWQFGSGRTLTPEDQATITGADPKLTPAASIPSVEPDSYGHANRILDILNRQARRFGRWIEQRTGWHED